MIDVQLLRLRELKANLGQVAPNIRNRLRDYMAIFTIRLRDQVKTNIAERFKSTGRLYNSVQSAMDEDSSSITGRVFTQGVPYARIQEEGGTTPPHEILPVNGKALAFMAPGRMQFKGSSANSLTIVKKVNHPGSRIPSRSYAALALVQLRSPFTAGIREVVNDGIHDAHLMAAE